MKFIFIRHGQTDYNKAGRLQGQEIDSPLNDLGLIQAKEVVQSINTRFDVIISSPLKRAYQTAEVIAEHFKKEILNDDNVMEKSYGSLAGKTWEEAENMTKGKAFRGQVSYNYRPYGGESADDVKNRVLRFIKETKGKYKGKIIIVVTHGGVVRVAHHVFARKELSHVENASVHEFDL